MLPRNLPKSSTVRGVNTLPTTIKAIVATKKVVVAKKKIPAKKKVPVVTAEQALKMVGPNDWPF